MKVSCYWRNSDLQGLARNSASTMSTDTRIKKKMRVHSQCQPVNTNFHTRKFQNVWKGYSPPASSMDKNIHLNHQLALDWWRVRVSLINPSILLCYWITSSIFFGIMQEISSPWLIGLKLPELCWIVSGGRKNLLRCSWCVYGSDRGWLSPLETSIEQCLSSWMWVQWGVTLKGAEFS